MAGESSVGKYVQLPHFIIDSNEYAGLDYADMVALDNLMRSLKSDNNGVLTFTKERANRIGMNDRTRAKALRRLESAGIILRMAKRRGTKPERYAIFWRPFSPDDVEVSIKQEMFWEWANRQRLMFQKYIKESEIPRALKPVLITGIS